MESAPRRAGAEREEERQGEAYRARVRLASEAIVFGLAAIFAALSLLPATTESDRAALQLTALLVLITGLTWFGFLPRHLFGVWRVFVACSIAQSVLTILLLLTGGASSPYFVFYVLPGLVLILTGNPRQVALLTATAAVALAWADTAGPVEIGRDALPARLIGFGTIAAFAMIAARATGRTRAELAERAIELAAAYEAADASSRIDDLTGLYNRRELNHRLAAAVADARRHRRPFAALALDVNGMKAFNDTLGHDAGDELLRGLADRLRIALRVQDVAVRVGGDEFVVLLPDTTADAAEVIADRVRHELAGLEVGGFAVRVSVGTAAWRGGSDGEDVLMRADDAMYARKHSPERDPHEHGH